MAVLTQQQLNEIAKQSGSTQTFSDVGLAKTAQVSNQTLGIPSPISVDGLNSGASPINVPQYTPTDFGSATTGALTSALTPSQAPQVSSLTDIMKGAGLPDLEDPKSLTDEYTRLTSTPEYTQAQKDFEEAYAELKALEAEKTAIPEQIQKEFEGRGVTEAGIAPIETARLRDNFLKTLPVAVRADVAQNRLTNAQSKINTLLDLQEKDTTARTKFFSTLYDRALTFASDIQAKQIRERQEYLSRYETQQNEFNTNRRSLVTAAINAGDYNLAGQIASAQTPEQLQSLAGRITIPTSAKAPITQKIGEDLYQYNEATRSWDKVISAGGGVPDTTPTEDNQGNTLVYGTPEYVISRLQQTSGSKTKPVASEREQLGKFGNVIAQTSNLIDTLSKTTTDPILGYLKSLNPYDFDARTVNAQVNALVPNVARGVYGEVGVLTDQDIERYLLTLPNIRSTEEQNKFVALMTLSNAMRSYEQTLLNLAASNVNVSGFVDSYKNITNQVNQLEKDLNIGSVQITGEDEAIFDSTVGTQTAEKGYLGRLWDAIMGR